jgi:hypothetical protein
MSKKQIKLDPEVLKAKMAARQAAKAAKAKAAAPAVSQTPAAAPPSPARQTAPARQPFAASKNETQKANTAAEKFRSLSDPRERAAYWASHRAEILGDAPTGTADRKIQLRAEFAAIQSSSARAEFWSLHRDELLG